MLLGRWARVPLHAVPLAVTVAPIPQARCKRHSTTEEALCVAEAMGAFRTVLTHFSQRYPRVPPGVPAEGPLAGRALAACDGMSLPLALLPRLHLLAPALAAALADLETADPPAEGPASESCPARGGL